MNYDKSIEYTVVVLLVMSLYRKFVEKNININHIYFKNFVIFFAS